MFGPRLRNVRELFIGSVTASLVLISGAFAQDLPPIGLALGSGDRLAPGTGPKHAIAMHGEPALPYTFRKLPFANDGAIKGGEITVSPEAYGADVAFDSLNPFIVKGNAYWDIRHLTFESLMARNPDEPFTLYGLLAKSIETPQDRSWVEFTLRKHAEFSDGTPLTIDDVIFSFETLREHGLPNMRRYYGKVKTVTQTGPRKVRFIFAERGDREAPLLLGLMPILSKAYYSEHEFNKTTLEPPIGSGPYIIASVDAGRSVTFRRNEKYWGQNLPINAGRNNFDVIKVESFRDENSKFEAFKKGLATLRFEGDPTRWNKAYDFTATRNALILLDDFDHKRPSGMYAFAFNTRREIFSDPRVRKALIYPFDFEWMNQNFFYNTYARTQSYFDNSNLSAIGPASAQERTLLAPWIDQVEPDLLEAGWKAPINGSRENARANAIKAMNLLKSAGWRIKDKKLTHEITGEIFQFEILLPNRSQERVALNYAKTLERLGIEVDVRVVDSAQFQQRLQTYDFDMVPFKWWGSLSPGNEQAFRWGSLEADKEGTYNIAGVKSPAVDALIGSIIAAKTRQDLVTATRALDRVLLSGYYVLPLYHEKADRIAWWGELQHPRRTPLMGWAYSGAGYRLSAWWMTSDN
jgi:peptide/nickel transport system substrate-binding protein